MPTTRRAFTLVELLVVIAIIALLVAILLPALANARKAARAAACLANLRSMGQGLTLYNSDHKDVVIPSFNMTGTQGGAGVPLDGWAPILDRDKYMPAGIGSSVDGNPFYCPDTYDVAGVATGQTGTDPNNPKGWHEWPFERQGTANVPVTIPDRGFNRVFRVAYWINADNPIGAVADITPDLYYTASVGYGPSPLGLFIRPTRVSAFAQPSRLIALADGVYAGRQRDNQIGTTNSRIGFRHPGNPAAANTAFADGHAAPLGGKEFPRGLSTTNPRAEVRAENTNGRPTVYADPDKAIPAP